MSIINDALKKAQVKLQEKTENITPKERRLWIAVSLIAITFGFIGCFAIFMYFIESRDIRAIHKTQQQELQITEKITKPQPDKILSLSEDIGIEPAEDEISEKTDVIPGHNLVLNGTMKWNGEYTALINNQIFREGDFVGPRRILNIYENYVELEDNGEIITLTINR